MSRHPVPVRFAPWLLAVLCLGTGCGRDVPDQNAAAVAAPATTLPQEAIQPPATVSMQDTAPAEDVQINIGDTRYLFVVKDHSTAELEALLERADEIARTSLDHFRDLKIEMVIHGPSVNMFTIENYEKNKKLIDLAAKLDAFNVIDLKICEKSLENEGISRDQIPAFIDSVPYAPDEIRRLSENGYINL